MGDALNGVSGLDIDEEKRLVDRKLNELRAEGATSEAIKEAMKDMGIERLVTKLIFGISISRFAIRMKVLHGLLNIVVEIIEIFIK